MKTFDLIVAIDEKNGIGKCGQLPWNLPGDMRHFKAITQKTSRKDCTNAVVMGRKTWESLPERFRPLVDRLNVVLTGNDNYPLPADVLRASSLEKAMERLCAGELEKNVDQVFVIGGASVYREAIAHPLCKKIYVTAIQGDFSCDAFFPFFQKNFKQVDSSPDICENGLRYSFCIYERG